MTPVLLCHKDTAKGTKMPVVRMPMHGKNLSPFPMPKTHQKARNAWGCLSCVFIIHGNISIWYLECTSLSAVDLAAVPVLEYCLLLSSGFSNNGAATGGAINHSLRSCSKYYSLSLMKTSWFSTDKQSLVLLYLIQILYARLL